MRHAVALHDDQRRERLGGGVQHVIRRHHHLLGVEAERDGDLSIVLMEVPSTSV